MKQQDNRETNNESIVIEGIIDDLSAPQAEEIKGGANICTCSRCAAAGGGFLVWDIVD